VSDALKALAKAVGLSPEWIDAAGARRTVRPETLHTVLRALGLRADTDAALRESREMLAKRQSGTALLIAREGESLSLGPARNVTIHYADGESAAVVTSSSGDGDAVIACPARPGYHRIETDRGTRALAIAPERCFTIADAAPGRRLAGLAVQLYALRGTRGFGDLGSLSRFAEAAAPLGIDAVAVSPLHARFLSSPADISPYSPSSRFFFDPLYADVSLAGGATTPDDMNGALVDWPQASLEKRARLEDAFSRFLQSSPAADFATFRQAQGERLIRHARFEALDTHFRQQGIANWNGWPQSYRDPQSSAVKAFAQAHARVIDFHIFLQWLTAKSLAAAQACARAAGMAVGLIADLAVGMNPNGSHAWSAPNEILRGLSVGAPPDIFNREGQDWGLTALSPHGLLDSGHDAFIATLRAAMGHAGGVRIDHAMGLRRLWLIPDGAGPGDGVYLQYPMADLLNLIALESHRHRAIVIGEDLGTVPEGFREASAERGILGMEVLWFQRDSESYLPQSCWSPNAAALTTTHDLPTLAGWWRGRDIDWQEKLGRETVSGSIAGEREVRIRDRARLWSAFEAAGCARGALPDEPTPAVEAALDFVGGTPCALAIVPVEDILALPEQPNIPGTIDEHPNWRRRFPPGDIFEGAEARANLASLRRARDGT
jgi:4-alpha-glucanotransferase